MALFGFGKKDPGTYGRNYPHISDRHDWDTLNRELYHEVVEAWPKNALALISNSREGATDLPKPYIRPGRDLDPAVREVITGFSRQHFDHIFDAARGKVSDASDCIKVKRMGLPDNTLVFLIEHRDGQHRTLLAFGGQWMKGKLEEHLKRVGQILRRKDTRTGQRIAAARAAPKGEVGALDHAKKVAAASTETLEARESALNARQESLHYDQRVELTRIQTELRRRARERR